MLFHSFNKQQQTLSFNRVRNESGKGKVNI